MATKTIKNGGLKMRYDVVLVINDAINSVKACIKSLAKVEYDKKLINIILVDNTSVAEITQILCSLKQDNNAFGGFEIIQSQKNKGVSFANNQGANCGSSPFVFFLNVNAQVSENLFLELDGAIEKNQNATAFECRCKPFETTSHIDPVTLEKPIADMRALVIKKDIFVSVGGFDRHLEGQCAVADLSWQICAVGAKIQYVPTAFVTFLTIENDEDKLFPYIMKHYETLLLNYKYANFAKILKAEKAYINEIKRPLHFENVRKELLKKYLKHFCALWHFLFYRFNFDNRAKLKKCEFKSELLTDRGREKLEPFSEKPLVSVVIRTYNKKDYLRLALTSIANQTYKNIEVIVAEDGEDTAQEMLKKEFSHLNIKYINDGVRKGRGANGNAGLKAASGEYCMFLDDDDLFYPEHIELFVSKA
ncbi:MAG: glycosyltransferase, partial [Oscillospiraceae bacterium]